MSSVPIPVAAALLLAAAPGDAGPLPAPRDGYEVAQLVIQQHLIVRVPRLPAADVRMMATRPIVWIEKKGPKCIALDRLAGALITRPDAVDLVQRGGQRIRAELDDDCPALDFYSGFYLKPTKDGKVCAERDAVRSRSGRSCEIASFRRLVAKQ